MAIKEAEQWQRKEAKKQQQPQTHYHNCIVIMNAEPDSINIKIDNFYYNSALPGAQKTVQSIMRDPKNIITRNSI